MNDVDFGKLSSREEIRLAFKDCVVDQDYFDMIDTFIRDMWGSQLGSLYALCKYDFEYMEARYGVNVIKHFESRYALVFNS